MQTVCKSFNHQPVRLLVGPRAGGVVAQLLAQLRKAAGPKDFTPQLIYQLVNVAYFSFCCLTLNLWAETSHLQSLRIPGSALKTKLTKRLT